MKKGRDLLNTESKKRISPPYKLAISVSEFADMLGVSRPKAYEIIRRDDFRGVFKVDKRTLISVPRAVEWIEGQAAKGEKP